MMDLDECIRLGLVRKVPPSPLESQEQFKKAESLLSEAKAAFNADAPHAAVLAGYAAALDAARALMFRDGFREKSHACVVRFLEARYEKEIGTAMIDLMDEYRDKRHKVQYSASYYATRHDAQAVLTFADALLNKIHRLIVPSDLR